jgi:3-isopropylmalate/(R)-2-methylmalate dehydratase large subunit
MAGKNVVQKILARAAGKEEVATGDYLVVRSSRPVTLVGDYLEKGAIQVMECGVKKVFNPNLIKIVLGHAGAGGDKAIGESRRKIRLWAEAVGVPRENILDLGQQGVEHIIAGEQCWALPGELYFSVADGHSTALGALGGLAVPLSYESGAYLIRGFSWMQVPEVARFTLTGTTKEGVFIRDVQEYILGQIGATGTPGQVILWDGSYVAGLSMDGRFTLCANALFSSAWTAIIEADQVTVDYVRACSKEAYTPLYGDSDAEYAQQRFFNVSAVEPQIVPPPERTHVFPVSVYEGTKITKGHIGACTNGRMEDMRVAARILKGRKVHPDVMLNITPGSVSIYRQCLKEGILEIFVDAGVFLPAPCCGQCSSGSNTPLGDNDVCISSGTCNYPGRMGSEKAEIYLGSPATIAASAVAGCITDPRNFLLGKATG